MKRTKPHFLLLILIILSILSCKQYNRESAANPNDFTFVFMTDIHLEPGRNAPTGFKQAIDSINKINPDFVLTGGDLIADALQQNYERADSLYNLYNQSIKDLKMPVYNTMGNHEIFGIFKKSGVEKDHPEYGKRMFEKRIGKRYYTFKHNDWVFMVLDGIEPGENRYYGKIDSVQIQWIKSQLDSIDKETPIIISTHIPFITSYTQVAEGSTKPNGDWLVIQNSKEVLDLFKDYKLKLVLQGHVHFLEDNFVNNIHFITGGAVCSKWWKGKNEGLEEGFLVVHINDDEIKWEYKDFGWVVDETQLTK